MKFNKLVPELSVSDFQKSLDFYVKVLGFKIEYERDNFAFLSFQGSQIMIEKANDRWKTGELEYPFGRGVNFQIEVGDVEAILKALKENDYPIKFDLSEKEYASEDQVFKVKELLVMDPDGYLLRFSQDIRKR